MKNIVIDIVIDII